MAAGKKKTSKKTASKKTATKKKKSAATKKTHSKKTVSKKASAKKPVVKKATAKKKTVGKKTTAKKSSSSSKPQKTKTAAVKKKVTEKTVAKKTASKKTPPKKATTTTTPTTKKVVKKQVPASAKKKVVKKSASKSTSLQPESLVQLDGSADAVVVDTRPLSERISNDDLDYIRQKLLTRKADLLGSFGHIESEYLGTHDNVTTKGGDEADQATTALTADLSLRLAESESKELRDIAIAFKKIEDGSYGICEATGQAIDVRRLKFLPMARLCLEAQKKVEAQELHYDEQSGWVLDD